MRLRLRLRRLHPQLNLILNLILILRCLSGAEGTLPLIILTFLKTHPLALNKNHEFGELDGVKCAIVEKNVPEERVQFLKALLEENQFTVMVVKEEAPKAAPKPATEGEPPPEIGEPGPALFTIGVTDVGFNAVNAIFGRLLKTKQGKTVTLAYWQGRETEPDDSIPYFGKKP